MTVASRIHSLRGRLRRSLGAAYWTSVVRGQVAECGPGLKVNFPSEVNGGRFVRLGANVHFNGMLIYGGGGLTIGDNFHSGRDCRIITENHRYEGAEELPYDSQKVKRPVTIGDNVWFGDSVTVLPGASIGDGAVLGACAVVTGPVPALAVFAGNPAREIKRRDAEEYRRLVEERRFH